MGRARTVLWLALATLLLTSFQRGRAPGPKTKPRNRPPAAAPFPLPGPLRGLLPPGAGPARSVVPLPRPPSAGRVGPLPEDTAAASEPPFEGPLPERVELEEKYFLVCDHDANGWISFREAEQSLGMDRTLYRGFDADRDGRIQRPEFSQRYLETVELLGTFKPPEPPPAGSELGGGAGLLSLADFDGNAALNEVEFSKLLAGHGFTPDETHQLLLRYDSNVSGELEQGELLEIAARMADGSLAPAEDARVPETLDELFGDPQERPASALGSSLPPRLVGPVTHFRRLDHDADGSVSAGDLLKLLSLIQVDVRAGAVLAFLDRDGNGVLDRQEFEAALE